MSVKTHFLNGGISGENSEERFPTRKDKSDRVDDADEDGNIIISEESRYESSSSASTVGIVFGVIFFILMVALVLGFVLHRKRIHPKALFERYGQQIL